MRLCDLMEYLVVYEVDLTTENKKQIITSYSQREWVRFAETFLRGIGSDHVIPGLLVAKLWGICDQARRQDLSYRQLWLLFHIIWENWHQISCEMRAILVL